MTMTTTANDMNKDSVRYELKSLSEVCLCVHMFTYTKSMGTDLDMHIFVFMVDNVYFSYGPCFLSLAVRARSINSVFG